MPELENVIVKVTSSTPGADTNTYSLFKSTVTFGTGTDGDSRNAGLQAHDISRVYIYLVNSQAGTLKAYESRDKGTNWDQVGGDIAVAANSSTDINGPYDFFCAPYADFKVDWVNGGSAQATWRPGCALKRGYSGAAT